MANQGTLLKRVSRKPRMHKNQLGRADRKVHASCKEGSMAVQQNASTSTRSSLTIVYGRFLPDAADNSYHEEHKGNSLLPNSNIYIDTATKKK